MNRLIYTIFFFLVFLKFDYLSSIENRIIVKVNNEIITSYDLKQTILTTLVLANQEINQEIVNQSKSRALKALINSILKKNETNKFNLTVSEIEFNNQLTKISGGDIEKFKKKFEINNLNFDLYADKLKTELKWRKLIFSIYQEKVKINEKEIETELAKMKKDRKKVEYKISEILLNFNDDQEKENIIKKINDQISKIGFEDTATKFSESTSAIDKGDLGWVDSNGFTEKISKSIIKLKINEVSEPILIGNSILFIKLKDKKTTQILDEQAKDLKNKIINSKKNELFNLYSTSHLSRIRNNSSIQYQ